MQATVSKGICERPQVNKSSRKRSRILQVARLVNVPRLVRGWLTPSGGGLNRRCVVDAMLYNVSCHLHITSTF